MFLSNHHSSFRTPRQPEAWEFPAYFAGVAMLLLYLGNEFWLAWVREVVLKSGGPEVEIVVCLVMAALISWTLTRVNEWARPSPRLEVRAWCLQVSIALLLFAVFGVHSWDGVPQGF